MPRDSSGVYGLPAGYLAVTGQTVLASQHNPPLEDLASAMTGSLPRNGSAAMLGDLKAGGFKITGVAAGVAGTDGVNKAQLDLVVPVGSVMDFAGSTAPAGWLMCYGQAVSRSTYSTLFSAVGTVYGVGDGSTTFNVPDLRGRAIAGKDDMGGTAANRLTTGISGITGVTLGASGGAEGVSLTIPQMPAHAHGGSVSGGSHEHNYLRLIWNLTGASGDNRIIAENLAYQDAASTGGGAHSHAISTEGSGTAHKNVQPTIVMNKIIRSGV